MLVSDSISISFMSRTTYKFKAFFELVKFRLSMLVVFSAAMGYLIAIDHIQWSHFILFCMGSFLITAGANAVNQLIEIKTDAMMERTQHRPLPTKRISKREALLFSILTVSAGLYLIYAFTNLIGVVLSFISFILYCFAYTPLKKYSPWAVFVGAFPGAAPPLIGWVAATGFINNFAIILFGIQFIWQFPHFWSIAWVLDEDYQRAGFRLLPSSEGKNFFSALQIMLYTLFLIPMGFLPFEVGMTSYISVIILVVSSILFVIPTVKLMKDFSKKAALQIMFASFLYLPIVLVTLLLDRV